MTGRATPMTFTRAFSTPDLRTKLRFTAAMVVLFRFGSYLPVPGVRLSVFALGIMPYITSSIILQLLTNVVPRLQTLKQQGRSGQAKISQYTRYLTIGLAVMVSATYIEAARTGRLFPGTDCTATSHPLIPHPSAYTLATMLVTMVSPL